MRSLLPHRSAKPRISRTAASASPARTQAGAWLAARILAREAVLGWMLWHATAEEPPSSYLLVVVVLTLLAFGTVYLPLAPTRHRWGTLMEGLAVCVGAVSVANILSITIGAPPVLHL